MQPVNSASTPPALPGVAETQSPPRLRRVLGLGDLVFYGIVLIQPVGAVGIFGPANEMSHGHVTTAILLALVAMMLTAWSYGRMAGLYPNAGSAYTYVGRSLNPHLGFLAGWAMFLDYLMIPVISVIFGAESIRGVVDALAPGLSKSILSTVGLHWDAARVSYVFWVLVMIGLMTFLNLRGMKWTARANQILTAAMFLVIGIFVLQAIRYLWARQGWNGLLSTELFYNPRTFKVGDVCTATSLAALTYIGFDGITTLAEDAKEPKRTIPLAIVLVCLVIGLCVGVQVYLAQRVWPDYGSFKNLVMAFFDVCSLVGGKFLFNAFSLLMVIASLGTALSGQVGAARILFGMGRDRALPKVFARLDQRSNPDLNIGLIGALALVGALSLPYERAAELVNFGALLAFMGVNLATIREFTFRPPPTHRRNWLSDLACPALGFAFCAILWCTLSHPAKVVGGIWCAVGIIYTAVKTRGFRTKPVMLDLSGG